MKKNGNANASFGHFLIYLFLTLGAVIMVIPFAWMFLTAFKTFPETMKLPIKWLPDRFILDNFAEVLSRLNFGTYYVNTVIVATSVTVLQLFVCSMAAYGFARLNAPGKGILFMFVLAMLMIPIQMTMLPSFVLLNKLKMINTIWVLIIPHMASSYGTFFLRQFFATLPKELEDAARIDGCSYFRCYWNIILPLCGTAVAAFAIFTVLWAWNDLLWPLIMTTQSG